MGMEIFTVQDKREAFVGEAGHRKLMENWTAGYYLLVLEHGCFLTDGKIHRFNDQCPTGIGDLHRWLRQDEDQAGIPLALYANPTWALQSQEHSKFCSSCFPGGPTADFITEEYLTRMTGLTPEQLQTVYAQTEGAVKANEEG